MYARPNPIQLRPTYEAQEETSWEGYAYMFHGSYSSKEKAESKARKRDGFLISRRSSWHEEAAVHRADGKAAFLMPIFNRRRHGHIIGSV